MSNHHWKIAPEIGSKVTAQFPELNPIVIQLLANRGLTTQAAIDQFLQPDYGADVHDPFLYLDMEKAVQRILTAIEKKQKIVVYGDYDADGVSATVIASSVIQALGAQMEVYIPFRDTEGYGLNQEAAEAFVDQKINLIVTVDCGISNLSEIEYLQKAGIDVIVTDHHQEPLKLPNAFAIINHNTKRDTYPYKFLSGAGVAFKLAQALVARHHNYQVKQLPDGWEKWLLDMTAIGTVADMMELIGENRTLVHYGLVVLKQTKRLGLQKLIELAGAEISEINERSIGFQIAPRINAAGRLDHAGTAYNLMVATDEQYAEELATQINTTNQQRQNLTEKITLEAKNLIGGIDESKKLLVAVGNGWPMGIVGLIAGRLADSYYRPTLVISEFAGQLVGSGRSIPGFDITAALQQSGEYLARYGGHAQACGFTVKDRANLAPFIAQMTKLAEASLAKISVVKELAVEVVLPLAEVDWQLYDAIEQFRPFGPSNPVPLFASQKVIVKEIKPVGKDAKHVRVTVEQNGMVKKMIGFGLAESIKEVAVGQTVDVAYNIEVNEWNGNRELQLRLVDVKITPA